MKLKTLLFLFAMSVTILMISCQPDRLSAPAIPDDKTLFGGNESIVYPSQDNETVNKSTKTPEETQIISTRKNCENSNVFAELYSRTQFFSPSYDSTYKDKLICCGAGDNRTCMHTINASLLLK